MADTGWKSWHQRDLEKTLSRDFPAHHKKELERRAEQFR